MVTMFEPPPEPPPFDGAGVGVGDVPPPPQLAAMTAAIATKGLTNRYINDLPKSDRAVDRWQARCRGPYGTSPLFSIGCLTEPYVVRKRVTRRGRPPSAWYDGRW